MENLDRILRAALEACDAAALENVRAGRGGPFAASLHVYDRGAGAWATLAGPVGNAVLETGVASAHAEDRVIVPAHVAVLRDALRRIGAAGAHVYVVSSGESCPACHAKLEILARHLLREGLVLPGRFSVVYGATYEDTMQVAGFNDIRYHDDFQVIPGTGLIRQSVITLEDLPEAVRDKLARYTGAVAVVADGPALYAGGGALPELAAIQVACALRQRAGVAEPWNLRGATLYSPTRQIGPLSYAEAQWANIGHWVTVDGAGPETIEVAELKNDALFAIIATRPYTHPDSALTFLHLTPFENRAQQEWRRLHEADAVVSYNGA